VVLFSRAESRFIIDNLSDASERNSTTHPQLVVVGGHDVQVVEVIALPTTDDAKKLLVIAWREVD
jgi:hypothetical protein